MFSLSSFSFSLSLTSVISPSFSVLVFSEFLSEMSSILISIGLTISTGFSSKILRSSSEPPSSFITTVSNNLRSGSVCDVSTVTPVTAPVDSCSENMSTRF